MNNNFPFHTLNTYDHHGNLLTQTEPVDISVYMPAINPQTIDITSLARYTTPIKTALGYTYDYTNNDQIASITDYRGETPATTSYQYTVEDGFRVTRSIDPAGNVTTSRANLDGTLHDQTDANGKTTSYSYYPNTPENRTAGIASVPEGSALNTRQSESNNAVNSNRNEMV